jgi:hypothetical protein
VPAFGRLREKECAALWCWTGLRLSQIDCAVIVTGIGRNRGWQALQVIDFKLQSTVLISLRTQTEPFIFSEIDTGCVICVPRFPEGRKAVDGQ